MKKNKKTKSPSASSGWKKFPRFLAYIAAGLVVILLLLISFFLLPKDLASVYVFPENPKQGDTVFIRVKTSADKVVGNLGEEQLVFFRRPNSNDWISLLGIDADQKPGAYKISVDTSNAEHLAKEIKVGLASFSSAAIVKAPAQQTGVTNQKAVSNIRNNDNPALKKFLGNFTIAPYFTSHFSFPLNTVQTSGLSFGKFIGFAKDKLQHLGVDLRAPEKTNIYAVNNGKVVATLDLSNYGKTVIIDHGLDIFSLYLHLEEFKVTEGQMVKRNQIMGLSGDTGYTTAPHLHFSVRVGSSRVDPIAFIEATKKIDENFFLADIMNAFLNVIK